MNRESGESRLVKAVHGIADAAPDPEFASGLAAFLQETYDHANLIDLYARFAQGGGSFDALMRPILWKALLRLCGDGLRIESGAGFKHPETFEFGNSVFIGSQAYLQGRFDGRLVIGNHVWIGPHSYLDARDLVMEDYVGWGPGAKVLGSSHTGIPADQPIICTDLEIRPVRVREGADIGTNAVILPGVTIGKGAIVGAGAVVTQDVPAFAVVAGVPAKFLRWREGYKPDE